AWNENGSRRLPVLPSSTEGRYQISRASTVTRGPLGDTPFIPMKHAIETSQISKSFGATRALAGIDLAIRQGSVYGLLGPNGAGKTTTVRILATLLRPDGGSAKVLGHDVVRDARAVREKVSLTGQYA